MSAARRRVDRPRLLRSQRGAALLTVLVILLMVTASSASFIALMQQQQSRAGFRMRAAAANALAEAGVHRALAILEGAAPDGRPGRRWRPSSFTQNLAAGSVEGRVAIAIAEGPGGALWITSTGQAGGIQRRLRAQVVLASRALLAAVYASSLLVLEGPPAAAVIVPYSAARGHPWVHVAAGRAVWLAGPEVSINALADAPEVGAGPLDGIKGPPRRLISRPAPIRLLVPRDTQAPGVAGVPLDAVLRPEAFPSAPDVDTAYYQALATTNIANAQVNARAGAYVGNGDLERKHDSLYTPGEFEQVQTYLNSGAVEARLRGVIYVTGGIALSDDQRLMISDGTLVAEGPIHLAPMARLEVIHSAATRALPGILVARAGALLVGREARLRVHGLVLAGRVIEFGPGAHIDVVGAIVGRDQGLSLRNQGTLIVRYDPVVLGTPGLRAPEGEPVVAWVAAWEELPLPGDPF